MQVDQVHGFITMSGQRGVNTALSIDGASGKSPFFGYGYAGEATQTNGSVIAQDSVKEFQIVTHGFNPEYGTSSGGYINVVTQSGTNDLQGSAFLYYRDDGLVDDIPSTPLDAARGIDGSRPSSEFERQNWGLTVGGPIAEDRTHFFFAYDDTHFDSPTRENIRTRGAYDAILARAATDPRFLALLEGFTPNADGIAAPDPVRGRTATGIFLQQVDNLILFGKVDHRFSDGAWGSLRVNYTDYDFESSFKDEESRKLEDTTSVVGTLFNTFGGQGLERGADPVRQ